MRGDKIAGSRSSRKQLARATSDFGRICKPTGGVRFLAEMSAVVPWSVLCSPIQPNYPKAAGVGGSPAGVAAADGAHSLSATVWLDLSDAAAEQSLSHSLAMRSFAGIDLEHEPLPDESTVLRFRRLLEAHQRGVTILEGVVRVAAGAWAAYAQGHDR
jgi:IS5 family transposase